MEILLTDVQITPETTPYPELKHSWTYLFTTTHDLELYSNKKSSMRNLKVVTDFD